MIELRYTCIKGQEVLQYRTWKVRIDASGAITPLPLPIEWTEWIIVPTAWLDKAKIDAMQEENDKLIKECEDLQAIIDSEKREEDR